MLFLVCVCVIDPLQTEKRAPKKMYLPRWCRASIKHCSSSSVLSSTFTHRMLYKRELSHPNRQYSLSIQSILSEYITKVWDQIVSKGPQQKGQNEKDNIESESCPHVFKMIPLHERNFNAKNKNNKSECTIYIKGFLSSHNNDSLSMPEFMRRNKLVVELKSDDNLELESTHFQYWKQSHQILTQKESHMWNDDAYGWDWSNGRFPHQLTYSFQVQKQEHEKLKAEGKIAASDGYAFNPLSYIPLPVTTLALVATQLFTLLFRGRLPWRIINPSVLLATVLQDIAFTVVVGYLEFRQANFNAKQYAHLLRDEILKLSQQYEKLRIVAHSLGAKHAVEAIKLLNVMERPFEVHLCAAALTENDYKDLFTEGLANRKDPKHMAYSYWSEQDYLLKILFPITTGGDIPIGCADLNSSYETLQSIHVDVEHFPKFYNQAIVHNSYNSHFHKFAK